MFKLMALLTGVIHLTETQLRVRWGQSDPDKKMAHWASYISENPHFQIPLLQLKRELVAQSGD